MKRDENDFYQTKRNQTSVRYSALRKEFAENIHSIASALAAAAAARQLIGTAQAQSAPKIFVLVHGAFLGGWCWRRVSDRLQKQGHRVYRPTFTGLGDRSHLLGKAIDIDTHVMDIVNLIEWEDLQDICLVAHSYGGCPASTVLDHIGERVSSAVWLDAFKPANGQRMPI